MNRIRNLAAVLAILIVSVVLASPVVAKPAETGADRFGGCLAAQKSGQILLMIDESGSLQSTDPQANRVTAAKYLARKLSQFSGDSGINLDIAIAGFSDDYHPALGWTKLDATSLPTVEAGIDGFKNRNNGMDTDYWLALDGARAAFGNAAKPANGKPCQALAWFTDGKLDFSQRNVTKPYAPNDNLNSQAGIDATIRAAQESICRDGGLADQLRSSDIITLAIGLAPTPAQNADFDLLKAIATGQPTGSVTSCGAIRSPTPGDFYLAQNIDDLLFAFDKFTTPGQPPIENTTGACAKVICEEGKHRFVLDRSVRSVSVLAAADRPGLIAYLVAPNGAPTELKGGPTTVDVGGVKVDYQSEGGRSVSIRMTNSQAPQWQGVWAVVFVDPVGDGTARTRSSIHISGDLYPAWPGAAKTALHSGDKDASLTFGLVDGRQSPVDPATLPGKALLSAVLTDVKGAEHPVAVDVPKDRITSPQVIDLSQVPPGAATLHLTLDITTADAREPNGTLVPGTQLASQRVDLPVTVNPPVGYPTIGDRIDFGVIEGDGTFTGKLDVTGPGCAWVPHDGAATVAASPDGVGKVTLDSSADSTDSCKKLAANQQAPLPIAIHIPSRGNGVVNGTVRVMVAPTEGGKGPVAVEVPFTASLHKPLNTTNFLVALLVALILGPGVPLLLLYLSKWLITRIPAKALRAQQIPVRVSGASVLRDNGPFAVRDGELVNLVQGLDKPARRLDLGGITLRTHIGLSPFGAGFVVASAPGRTGAAGKSAAMHGKTPDAKLPLAVHNTWFVLRDPAGPPDAATVVLLVGGDAGTQVIERLVSEINASLPRVLSDLVAKTTTGGNTPPSSEVRGDNPFEPSGSSAAGANPFAPGGGNPYGQPSQGGNPFGSGAPPSGGPFSPGPPSYRQPSYGQPSQGSPSRGPSNPFDPGGSPNPFGPSGSPGPPPPPGGGDPTNPFR